MNKNKRRRVLAGVLSLALVGMNLPPSLVGELRAAADKERAQTAAPGVQALEAFADRAQEISAQDTPEDYFDKMTITAGQEYALEDGKPVLLGGRAALEDGELMVPAAFFGEEAGASVAATGDTRLVPLEETAEQLGYSVTVNGRVATLTNDFQTARLIIKAAGSIDTLGATQVAAGYQQLHIHQYASPAEAFAAYQTYQTMEGVEFVQPSVYMELAAESVSADQLAASAKQAVQQKLGSAPAAIDGAHTTWGADTLGVDTFCDYLGESFQTLPEVVVAVVDTGVDYEHEWLTDRIVDGGKDFTGTGTAQDDYGHGTHVSGTICDLTLDNVKILPVKVLDAGGGGTTEQIYFGMCYAVEMGADVANLSLGGFGSSPLYEEVVTRSVDDTIFCFAAGNESMDANLVTPANVTDAITVAAVDSFDNAAEFSNFGTAVDLAAPGVDITSAAMGGGVISMSGTSMASPHVAGCCALLKSYDKTLTTAGALEILKAHAIDLGEPGYDRTYGYGRVSMDFADMLSARCTLPVFSLESGSYTGVQTVTITGGEGETIYYTTDNSVPSAENGNLYTEPLTVSESTIVHAMAVKEGSSNSSVAVVYYKLDDLDVANALVITDGTLVAYNGLSDTLDLSGETLTAIGAEAFCGNAQLTTLVLPETVTEIGDNAFRGCQQLTQLTAPGVTTLGDSVFFNCAALTDLTTGVLTEAGAECFACSGVSTVDASGLKTIADGLFRDCALLSSLDCSSATKIGSAAFQNCYSLSELTLQTEQITDIGAYAFQDGNLSGASYDFSALQTVGEYAFSGTTLQALTMSADVTVLPQGCFESCTMLTALDAPGVTVVEDTALALLNFEEVALTLNWSKLTKVGEAGMAGLVLTQPVQMDALTEVGDLAFALTEFNALSLPNVTDMTAFPMNAFAITVVHSLQLKSVQKLPMLHLLQTFQVVIGADCTEIQPFPVTDGMIIVSEELGLAVDPDDVEYPAFAGYAGSYVETFAAENGCKFTAIPAIGAENVVLETTQYSLTQLDAAAFGFDLAFQWYQSPDGVADGTAIDGATNAVYETIAQETGTQYYWCSMTDPADNKTHRSGMFTVNVAAAELTPLTEGEYVEMTQAAAMFSFTPAADGNYYLVSGGEISDITAIFFAPDGSTQELTEGMSLALTGGVTYAISVDRADGRYHRFCLRNEENRPLYQLAEAGMTTLEAYEYVYTGSAIVPALTVTVDETELTAGVDYEVVYTNNVQMGTATVLIYGLNDYEGCLTDYYQIKGVMEPSAHLSIPVESAWTDVTATFTPEVSGDYALECFSDVFSEDSEDVYMGNITISVMQEDYTSVANLSMEWSYLTNGVLLMDSMVTLEAGETYRVNFVISNMESCMDEFVARLRPMDSGTSIENVNVLYDYDLTYSGKPVSPPIMLSLDDGTALVEGTDYLLFASKTILGDSTVFVRGINDYYGEQTCFFTVLPSAALEPDGVLTTGEELTLDFAAKDAYFYTLTPEQDRIYTLAPADASTVLYYTVYEYDQQGDWMNLVAENCAAPYEVELTQGSTYLFCLTTDKQASVTCTLTEQIPLSLAVVTTPEYTFTGSIIEPEFTVTYNDTELVEGTDYLVSELEQGVIGAHAYTLEGIGNYAGEYYGGYFIVMDETMEDLPLLDIGTNELTIDEAYTAVACRLTTDFDTLATAIWTDAVNGVEFVIYAEGTEECVYAQNGDPLRTAAVLPLETNTTYYVIAAFMNPEQTGSFELNVLEESLAFSDVEISYDPMLVANGTRQLPEMTLTYCGEVLVDGVDYRVIEYVGGVDCGYGTAYLCGMGCYFGSQEILFNVYTENPDVSNAIDCEPEQEIEIAPTFDEPVVLRMTAPETGNYSYFMYSTTLFSSPAIELNLYDAELKPMMPSKNESVYLEAGETVYLIATSHEISTGVYLSAMLTVSYIGAQQFEDGFTFELDEDGNAVIVGYESMGESSLTIPSELLGATVVGIGDYAMAGMESLNTLTLPETLQFIGEGAFFGAPLSIVLIPRDCTLGTNCLGFDLEGNLLPDFQIYGYIGSDAERYATENNIPFVSVDPVSVFGDVNEDTLVDANDAIVLLKTYAQLLLSGETPGDELLVPMDINGDGAIDASDAILILKAYAQSMLTGTIDWDALLPTA